MNLSQLQDRVRREALRRIKRGTLTVTLLARSAELSQSHISNFLNARRNTSLENLDKIILALGLDIADLLSTRRGSATTLLQNQWGEAGRIPLVAAHVATHDAYLSPSSIQEVIAFPAESLSGLLVRCSPARRQWERFVAVRIGPEEALGMEPLILPEALVVIDRHYTSFQPYRESPGDRLANPSASLYAAISHTRNADRFVIRYAQFEAGRVIFRRHRPGFPAEVLQIPADRTATDLITGRIALILNTL
jgi:transcriptional regulator with XRE-family HTH domain